MHKPQTRLRHLMWLLPAASMMSAIAAVEAAPAPAPNSAPQFMTEPEDKARVKGPLPMIHVMFREPIDLKMSGLEVRKADGTRVEVGDPMPMGDTILMAMPKTPLPAGSYNVKWHAASGSKKLAGEFSFTVQ
jgi:methionine-rich copper-binding protein CopC